jgi:hypothetical protein
VEAGGGAVEEEEEWGGGAEVVGCGVLEEGAVALPPLVKAALTAASNRLLTYAWEASHIIIPTRARAERRAENMCECCSAA